MNADAFIRGFLGEISKIAQMVPTAPTPGDVGGAAPIGGKPPMRRPPTAQTNLPATASRPNIMPIGAM